MSSNLNKIINNTQLKLKEYEDLLNKTPLRYCNMQTIPEDKLDDFTHITCFIRSGIKEGHYKELKNYCNNLVYLNPWIPLDRLYRILHTVNTKHLDSKLSIKQVELIAKRVVLKEATGKLLPVCK